MEVSLPALRDAGAGKSRIGVRAFALAAMAGCALLAGCDGGSSVGAAGTGVVAPPTPATPTPTPATPTPSPSPTVTRLAEAEAARLAKQASFGATPELVERIVSLGLEPWLDEQFAATGSSYADLAANPMRYDACPEGACRRANFSRTPVAMRFYADAMTAPDQLRQRLAFALSQMIVASETEVKATAGIAAFNQIFLTHAFGNYRDILQAVTLNGMMGAYLDMADSSRKSPSENYAREMLQLFSMGPDQLNLDGTPKLDATGARIPNYASEDIRGIARALTGWTQAKLPGAAANDRGAIDYSQAMVMVPGNYDSGEKRFLGTTVAAGASQAASVAAVVDAAFGHPSTAPFVSRYLIVHLVTANPSSAYVGRVTSKFVDNGSGVRGDLKAVVRAILTDPEARGAPGADSGKIKEPVLMMTALARAIGFTTDGYMFVNRDTGQGQPVMNAPSVFSFYPVDFPLQGTSLKSPASKLLTTTNILRWNDLAHDWTVTGEANFAEFTALSGLPLSNGSVPQWSKWEALGTDVDAMIARIDLLLFANTLAPAHKNALRNAATAVTNADPAVQARKRAQTMLYIAASSPLFLVDR